MLLKPKANIMENFNLVLVVVSLDAQVEKTHFQGLGSRERFR